MKVRVYSNLLYLCIVMALVACAQIPSPSVPEPTATLITNTPTLIVPIPTSTATLVTEPIPTQETPDTPIASPTSAQQFIAYVQNGQLLVTDVTNGIKGGTTQYTVAGENDQVVDFSWSPSGEFIVYVSIAKGEPHLFYIFALGQSTPADLGPGSALAWSPDSKSIAYIGGTNPDENIWITTIDNPAPRQLTFQTNFAWGRPAFTPDGQSLVVASADRNNMGAQGNTTFTLESLALDGVGTRSPLPGTSPVDGARLPYDLRFSPDGTKLAYSTSYHLSACASPGAYYVSNPDGSNRQELVSPSLTTAIDPSAEHYHVGLSYTWSAASDALIATGNIVDCAPNSATSGQILLGPQMSVIGLDGSERLVIPGLFFGISTDRTGTWIAAAHYQDFQDLNPMVQLYSAQTGQIVLPLDQGNNPQFQP